MPEHPSAVSGAFRRPFREQAAFFRQKLGRLVPTQRWDDLDRQQHDTAFMVAGAMKADLLADLAAAVDRAVVEGTSLETFRKDFEAAVDANDWHGWTGEDTKGGRAWRTRTIYRTNAATSYAAGRYAQLTQGNFALWLYRHGDSKEPRPQHLALDGLALPPTHIFWATYYPPSDWGCSCYVLGARSARAVARLGGDPDKKLPEGWDTIDPRTGTPPGVGQGWDYAPGASVAPAVAVAADKVRHWDYQISKAFMGDLPEATRDALSQAYRRLPSVADDTRRYARRVLGQGGEARIEPIRTLGMATADDIAAIHDAKSIDVAGYDYSLAPSDIQHVQNRHGVGNESVAGQMPVTIDDYALLPTIVAAPDVRADAGRSDIGEPLIRLEKVIAGARYVVVFAVRGGKRRTLALKTFYIKAVK